MKNIPYLPIGSVVLLKNGKKRVMIYGRKVRTGEEVYDYLGCLYPEGILNSNDVIVFNQEQIQMVYFIGFQDLEEIVFRARLRETEE
ncbi:MAG: DUF4176 domain-containing protein [Lachnospiraceae bacterium]|nr:DUF4176 domain-containing protein [Lachnospiraceae bacterium]